MASYTKRPIILPLSNPTSLCEALPKDVIKWSDGRAFVCTGSPFADVIYKGKTYVISQCNNALIFPGLTLGMIASQARKMTKFMVYRAYSVLAAYGALSKNKNQILPTFDQIKVVNFDIAVAVAK